jgi:hypothetical protein
MLWKRIVVRHRERVLLFKDERFSGILMPGVHRVLVTSHEGFDTEKHELDDLIFQSAWTGYLLEERPEIANRHFTVVQTSSRQVAMVYVNGALFTVMVPQKRMLFWRDAALVTAEIVNVIGEPRQRTQDGAENARFSDRYSTAYTCV